MKTNVIFRGTTGYTMIDGILCHYDFEAVYMTAWKEIKYVSSNNRDILWDIDLYASTKDFEEGNQADCGEITLSDKYAYEKKDDDGRPVILTKVWMMVNGQPMECTEALDFVHTYRNIFEPVLKEGMYKSRIECLKFNSYQYEDEEGNLQTKVGIGKKVQLTDEQRKFIDEEFVGVLNKAKEMGIMLVLNNSTEYLYAANTKQLKDGAFDIDYSSDIDNDLDWINSDYFYKVPEQVLMMEGEETVYSE